MNKAQAANELTAFIDNIVQTWPEGVDCLNSIDRQAMAIEADIPADTKNVDAIKAREYAQLARKFGMTDKGVNYIADAQAAFKDYMLFEDAVKGEEHRKAQQKKARKSRGKITEDGETISDLIERLARQRDALGDYVPAPSLWEPLFSALQNAGADPKETRNNGKPRQTFYSYTTAKGTSGEIRCGTFETKISAYRKKLSR